MRNESLREAIALDHRLRAIWSAHPRFVLVPHERSFFHKMSAGLAALEAVVRELAELDAAAERSPT
ncbi:MAG: hypothetical protein R3A79_21120 [Nannocystaceae bacterium]